MNGEAARPSRRLPGLTGHCLGQINQCMRPCLQRDAAHRLPARPPQTGGAWRHVRPVSYHTERKRRLLRLPVVGISKLFKAKHIYCRGPVQGGWGTLPCHRLTEIPQHARPLTPLHAPINHARCPGSPRPPPLLPLTCSEESFDVRVVDALLGALGGVHVSVPFPLRMQTERCPGGVRTAGGRLLASSGGSPDPSVRKGNPLNVPFSGKSKRDPRLHVPLPALPPRLQGRTDGAQRRGFGGESAARLTGCS
ncbi:hypothetical protein NDU88_006969 [Pleurodeles waltl]|uniref:Uncharacterized protein n=1 Tax=Pleurodeles waltl TaxID=8319 RepID=A0AAV7UNJ3_PLEWA|nr:hypothetical protein NDU88_006969 [Pleurodeles waltl]